MGESESLPSVGDRNSGVGQSSSCPQPSLTSLFDTACSNDGDSAAFLLPPPPITLPADDNGNGSRQRDGGDGIVGEEEGGKGGGASSVGFTELREASVAIGAELVHRHGCVGVGGGCASSASASASATATAVGAEEAAGGSDSSSSGRSGSSSRPPLHQQHPYLPASTAVLIVSTHPSPGEAAAVVACTRCRIPFVPVDLIGPNNAVGSKRLATILGEVRPVCAIVVVEGEEEVDRLSDDAGADGNDDANDNNNEEKEEEEEGEDDDYLTSPALPATTANARLDRHPVVRLLESSNLYRHVLISSRDGAVLNGLSTLADLPLPTPIIDETRYSCNDALYVMYTSGSSTGRGRAVVQTHGGLLNRIRWQWKTFPFVQQIRREVGPVECAKVLRKDGLLVSDGDVVVRRTPLSFVDSVAEIFGTLLAGVPLYCPSSSILASQGLPGILAEAERVGATRVTMLPSQLGQCLRLFGDGGGGDDGDGSGSDSGSGGWPWPSLNLAIVSGEPCPPSLPSLWEQTVCRRSNDSSLGRYSSTAGSTSLRRPRIGSSKKVLVNLYGQTETSGDVLCMVVSTGGGGGGGEGGNDGDGRAGDDPPSPPPPPLARFPLATPYLFRKDGPAPTDGGGWWQKGEGEDATSMLESSGNDGTEGIERCLRWTVPCGLPLSGHSLTVGLPDTAAAASNGPAPVPVVDGSAAAASSTRSGGGASAVVGRLHVAGPGVALGYLNRPAEDAGAFRRCIGSAASNGEGGVVDDETKKEDEKRTRWFDTSDLAYRDPRTGFYYVMGRAPDDGDDNGGGDIVGRSRVNGLSTMGKVNGVLVHTSEIEAVFTDALAEVMRQRAADASTASSGERTTIGVVAVLYKRGEGTRTAVFVDSSSSPSTEVAWTDGSPFHSVLREAKSLLLDRGSIFACHPSLVPHSTHVLTCLPTNGAAGKVDRSELVRMTTGGVGRASQDAPSADPTDDDAPLTLIRNIFAEVLSLNPKDASLFEESLAFVEMGGDSLTAIEAAHKLTREARTRLAVDGRTCDGRSSSSDRFSGISITALDVMNLPVQQLCAILLGEKDRKDIRSRAQIQSLGKGHQSLSGVGDGDDPLRRLADTALVSAPTHRSSRQEVKKRTLHVAYKCPLLMCVDATPLIVRHASTDGNDAVLVGSQGGDIVCADVESGMVLHRRRLPGKIEGGMAYTDVDCSPHGQQRLVFACTYSSLQASSKASESSHRGSLHAFALSSVASFTNNGRKRRLNPDPDFLSPIWTQVVAGELKGAPACFKVAGPDNSQGAAPSFERFGVLIAGYDGVVRYLDALTGREVANCDDLGGAIHASPVIYNGADLPRALISSSTWTGRVTCLQLNARSMTKMWFVDHWAPIYGTPFVHNNNGSPVGIFGAVDGAVRCVDFNTGTEVWKTYTRKEKPIFTGCCPMKTDQDEVCVVVGSHDGSVSCIRAKDGRTIWVFDAGSAVLGTAVALDNSIVFATTSGFVFALNKLDGKVEARLKDRLQGEVFSPPTADLDSRSIFIGCRDNFLYKIWG